MSLYTYDRGIESGFSYSIEEADQEILMPSEVIDRMGFTDDSNFDIGEDVILTQIKAVRKYLELKLGMSLVSAQTITAYWDTFSDRLVLPFYPIISITSVSTIINGIETAMASDQYWTRGGDRKAIHFDTWGNIGLKVVYEAGITNEAIVSLVKDALMSEVLEWYNQRTNPDETQYVLGKIALSKLNVLTAI